ncbi:MAG TPA: minichromosome maintenance protein MCM [Candidatus Thermoplasmatota archaeon]|nr:minichromosome maintenance protein MCM [Candidatus Thermoplasmatota archaeon]
MQREAASSEDPQTKNWERFLKTYCKARVNEAAQAYPAKRSVVVSFWDLERHDPQLADWTLLSPTQSLRAGEEALKSIDMPVDPRPKLHLRLENLPESARVEVRDLRGDHMGKIIAVKGLVKKVTEVRPKIQDALYQCKVCGSLIRESQDEHLVLKEPVECYEDQGGCGRSGSFRLVLDEARGQRSSFIDTQKIEIQESPENMRGGEQPQRLVIYAEDDLCGLVAPGDRVTVNGILRSSVRKQGNTKSTILDIHLESVYLEMDQEEYDEVEITPEEEEEIRRASRDPELYLKMRASIAPEIYGMEAEKEALLLQLFGGLAKRLPNGGRLRGDIHILFVGDPGVAKSQLIREMSRLAPRGIYTSGKSSSAAGLTAAAVKDDFGEGRWTLEAGALVLADKGIACIDEIDKMDKNDQSSMHEAMEQQTISIAKAGISATLQSRCAILGAANPKLGRFDPFQPITDQINFPPALLSRFDCIFVLTDKPEAARDAMLASHILEVHRGGAMNESIRNRSDSPFTVEDVQRALRKVDPAIDSKFLRKYVAFAKRSCFPVITQEAKEKIRDYYVGLRRQAQGENGGPIPLTARQLEAFVRLSEASAKVRLSDEANGEDADRAIRIVEYYLRRIAGGEGGLLDIDLVSSGVSHSQRQVIPIIEETIRRLSAGTEFGAPFDEVLRECESQGVPPDKTRDILKRLKQNGTIFEPRSEHFRLASR